jgi:hypothetical protein
MRRKIKHLLFAIPRADARLDNISMSHFIRSEMMTYRHVFDLSLLFKFLA